MPRELVFEKASGQFELRELYLPVPGSGDAQVRIELAAPKHGTEAHHWTGQVCRGRRWDPYLRLFQETSSAASSTGTTTRPVGNMAVGVVEQIGDGVEGVRPGDRVYGYMPVREVHVCSATKLRPLPPDLAPEAAVCVDPAHVAFVAVRDGQVRIGDWVAVFGLGAIGLLTVQMALASGAEGVVAVDPLETRRERAQRFGAYATLDPTTHDVAVAIKATTGGHGVDIALETSGVDSAMHEAIRSVRQCGTVVGVGWGSGSGAGLYLGEEFHVNRPTLIASQASSYWGNPDRDYPRWDEPRAQRSCADLFRRGKISAEGILDPIVSLEEAPRVLQSILTEPGKVLKVGIRLF